MLSGFLCRICQDAVVEMDHALEKGEEAACVLPVGSGQALGDGFWYGWPVNVVEEVVYLQ